VSISVCRIARLPAAGGPVKIIAYGGMLLVRKTHPTMLWHVAVQIRPSAGQPAYGLTDMNIDNPY
jgi:hypothetical protein